MAVEMIRQEVITSQAYQTSVKRLLLQPLVRVTSHPKTGLKTPEKTTYIKDFSLSPLPLLSLFEGLKHLFCGTYRQEE